MTSPRSGLPEESAATKSREWFLGVLEASEHNVRLVADAARSQADLGGDRSPLTLAAGTVVNLCALLSDREEAIKALQHEVEFQKRNAEAYYNLISRMEP